MSDTGVNGGGATNQGMENSDDEGVPPPWDRPSRRNRDASKRIADHCKYKTDFKEKELEMAELNYNEILRCLAYLQGYVESLDKEYARIKDNSCQTVTARIAHQLAYTREFNRLHEDKQVLESIGDTFEEEPGEANNLMIVYKDTIQKYSGR